MGLRPWVLGTWVLGFRVQGLEGMDRLDFEFLSFMGLFVHGLSGMDRLNFVFHSVLGLFGRVVCPARPPTGGSALRPFDLQGSIKSLQSANPFSTKTLKSVCTTHPKFPLM